jgi:hypothetical protein
MKRHEPIVAQKCAMGESIGIPRICIWNHECRCCGFAQWIDEVPCPIEGDSEASNRFEVLAAAA